VKAAIASAEACSALAHDQCFGLRLTQKTEPCRDLGLIYPWIINPGITHLQVLQDGDLYDG